MPDTIADRISSRINGLSPKLQHAARFVAENPQLVATRSLRHLAGLTQLTPTTFSRLAGALGFSNYEALRNLCRDQLNQQRLVFSEKARVLQAADGTTPDDGMFVVRQGAAALDNINRMIEAVDPEQIETASQRLLAARRVLLIGSMSSMPFVEYLAYMASMAFTNWLVLGSGAQSEAATLADMDRRDVALVIAKSPNASRTVVASRQVRRQGAHVIAILDDLASPLSQHCDGAFFVPTSSPQFFSSHVATLVLLETLMGMIVARAGADASRRIAAVESASHQLGEYYAEDSAAG